MKPGRESSPDAGLNDGSVDLLSPETDYLSSEDYWNRYYRERPVDEEWCMECCSRVRSTFQYSKTWQVLCEDRVLDGLFDSQTVEAFLRSHQFYFPRRDTVEDMAFVNCSLPAGTATAEVQPGDALIGYNVTIEVVQHSSPLTLSYWRGVRRCSVQGIHADYKATQFSQAYNVFNTIEVINLVVASGAMAHGVPNRLHLLFVLMIVASLTLTSV